MVVLPVFLLLVVCYFGLEPVFQTGVVFPGMQAAAVVQAGLNPAVPKAVSLYGDTAAALVEVFVDIPVVVKPDISLDIWSGAAVAVAAACMDSVVFLLHQGPLSRPLGSVHATVGLPVCPALELAF